MIARPHTTPTCHRPVNMSAKTAQCTAPQPNSTSRNVPSTSARKQARSGGDCEGGMEGGGASVRSPAFSRSRASASCSIKGDHAAAQIDRVAARGPLHMGREPVKHGLAVALGFDDTHLAQDFEM